MQGVISQERIPGGLPLWQKEIGPGHHLDGIHDGGAAETLAGLYRMDYSREHDGVARPRHGRPEGWLATIYHQPQPRVRSPLNYSRLPPPEPPPLADRLCRAITRWLGWDRNLLGSRDRRIDPC